MDDVDPARWYCFSEAAALLPSCRKGKRLNVATLHRWRREGRLPAEYRQSGDMRYWFVRGDELMKLIGGGKDHPPPTIRSPAQARRGLTAALDQARAMGLIE